MSDNGYNVDLDALTGDGEALLDWYDTQPDLTQFTSPGYQYEGLGFGNIVIGTNTTPLAWDANAGTHEMQTGFNQFTAPGTQQDEFGIGNTLLGANDRAMLPNTVPSITGADFGLPFPVPDYDLPPSNFSGVGSGFMTNIFPNPTTPFIGQGQAPDGSVLLQPDAGFDATADR